MSLPVWHTDLRSLFMLDPFSHSGIYDGFSFILGEDGKPVPVKDEFGRGAVQKVFRDEAKIQDGIATLLLAEAPPIPAAPTPDGNILRRLRRTKRLLLSAKTLQDYFQDPLDHHWLHAPLLSRRLPSALETKTKILENRENYLHPLIPDGIILEVLPDMENVGLINAPEYFPYPVGLGVRPKAVRAVYRLEPWRYPRARTSS